jgi:hypothetical protein
LRPLGIIIAIPAGLVCTRQILHLPGPAPRTRTNLSGLMVVLSISRYGFLGNPTIWMEMKPVLRREIPNFKGSPRNGMMVGVHLTRCLMSAATSANRVAHYLPRIHALTSRASMVVRASKAASRVFARASAPLGLRGAAVSPLRPPSPRRRHENTARKRAVTTATSALATTARVVGVNISMTAPNAMTA